MKLIATLEELVEHAVAVAQGRASWEGVDILPGAAAIPIRVQGTGWGKHIDARGAAFVTSMQAKLDEMFGSYPGQLPSKAPLIKVEVREGSNELLTFLEPLVKMVIDKVSAEQVVEIIKYGILCLSGVWTIGKVTTLFNEMDERRISKEKDSETLKAVTEQQKQALAVISQSVEAIRQVARDDVTCEQKYAAPLKRYINSLDDNDRVRIGSAPPVNVQRAKRFFRTRRPPRSDMYHVVCDAPMNVLGLNFEKPKPRLDIEQDGKKYIALIERLSDEERQYLISQVDNRLKSEGVLCMDLRVTAYFKNSGLNRICIVGLGKPRENVTINALMDIPNDVRGVFDEFQRAPDS